jgi:hypothetical protein
MPAKTLTALLIILCGCSQQPTPTQSEGPPAPPANAQIFPPSLQLAAAPTAAPTSISDLKAKGKAGDDVVVKVTVGGRSKPLVEKLAVMTVVDAALPNACTTEDDECTTFWDYCCTGKTELTGAMATVRVVDDSGNPLAADLTGANVKPGDTLLIAGKIAEKNESGVLVIDATGFHKP